MKIKIIDIREIDGFKLGNAEDINNGTGCTVIISENGAVGGVDVRGGAPATRETDLLRSENTVDSINAVVLSGGSAFGLEAASGVMRELSDRGIGYDLDGIRIPIVCGASLFDLNVGDGKTYPDIEMGREAVRNAFDGIFEHGNRGAGTGASVGKIKGMNRAMKSGLGTFACGDEYVQVGAIVAVNAVGDIYNGAGNIIAGLRTEEGDQIFGTIKALKPLVHEHAESIPEDNDNEIEESTDYKIERKIGRDTQSYNKAEIANAIKNAFTNRNPESPIIFEDPPETEFIVDQVDNINSITDFYTSDMSDMMITGRYSREEIEQAQEESADVEDIDDMDDMDESDMDDVITVSDVLRGEADDEDMGYDISFNTTIACIITNAKMTKPEANKLASILHDAYARAIKPVHSTMDGDTVFVLTSGSAEVNFDAFAALATDVLQYAIIDAASSAKSAYGLPAAYDIIKK